MGMIAEAGVEAASNTDVLNGTRLITVTLGILIVEVQASLNNATNRFLVSLSLPGGEAPWLDLECPGNNPALDGVLDDRTVLKASFDIIKEGHATLAFTEVGTALVTWRVTNIFA